MMDRRTALAAAGAVVLTVATAAVAVAANLGVLDRTDDTVGNLQPVTAVSDAGTDTPTPVETETIHVDEYVTDPLPTTAAPAAPVGAADDDRAEGDDQDEGDDHDEATDDDHEDREGDEEHEYEGGEDDD